MKTCSHTLELLQHQYHTSGLSKEVYNFVLPQGAQKLPAKVQIKSPIYTILLSKSDFSFALLLVTFELLEVEQSYIPLLKALVSGINAVGAQGCGCMFRLCHTSLKMGLLLHKTEKVCRLMLSSVYTKEGFFLIFSSILVIVFSMKKSCVP